jgi:saccharopine dehydrogenase-like NADP-dependent oxidoreductase
MKKRVLVLGGGLVGGVMARDIAADAGLAVTVVDLDETALSRLKARAPVEIRRADLADPAAVRDLCAAHDLILGAAPGFLGFQCLRAAIESGRPVVDISFMPEDALELDGLARAKGVTAVVDCGVAPGMSNFLVGHVESELDETEEVLILVGGLPVVRRWPYEYVAVFSPIDVLEEYTRPARFVENGVVVVREALSDPELVDLPGVGTVEAFNTDGLRSLLTTVRAPNLKEKTLRWPGHIDKIRLLRATGLFGREPVEVGGVAVQPIDLTAKLLFPIWKRREGEEELTVMRVVVKGRKGAQPRRYTYDLLDRTDTTRSETSMARTTGFPATAVARLILEGALARPGVHPPEVLGRERPLYERVMASLEERGLRLGERIE